jgi:hypothetical protein
MAVLRIPYSALVDTFLKPVLRDWSGASIGGDVTPDGLGGRGCKFVSMATTTRPSRRMLCACATPLALRHSSEAAAGYSSSRQTWWTVWSSHLLRAELGSALGKMARGALSPLFGSCLRVLSVLNRHHERENQ